MRISIVGYTGLPEVLTSDLTEWPTRATIIPHLRQFEQKIIGDVKPSARAVIISTNEYYAWPSMIEQIVGKGADGLPYAIWIR